MKNSENILIIGYGEIGKSIHGLYEGNKKFKVYPIDIKKKNCLLPEKVDVLHICIPYYNVFTKDVINYIKQFKPKLTIIHSTVMILTTEIIYSTTKAEIVHSPIMGKHPNLTKSMRTFKKIIGSYTKTATKKACSHFKKLGVKTVTYNTPEETELTKLLDTTYYAWNIIYMQNVHNLCKEWRIDFENVYTKTNEIYNEGYAKLGDKHVIRPVLKYMGEGIGNHCLFENATILDKSRMIPTIVKPIIKAGKPKEK